MTILISLLGLRSNTGHVLFLVVAFMANIDDQFTSVLIQMGVGGFNQFVTNNGRSALSDQVNHW